MNKYRNVKVVYNGIRFDSKREASRYAELKILERMGKIKNLRLQVKFEICPKKNNNKRSRYYIADFTYEENGQRICEDVKSWITRRNPVYSLKKALMLANYPEYEFREVL